VRAPAGEAYVRIKETLRSRTLYTVCEEARCPNVAECWASGTATFMLLGDVCTRACQFCAVKTGNPLGKTDVDEPRKLFEAIESMKLKYAVITTVDRDDLADGGAAHLAHCLTYVRTHMEHPPMMEMLTGDFRGNLTSLHTLCNAEPDVFAHNVETVPRLTPEVRDRRATFSQSLQILSEAAKRVAITKSSIMVGMGESGDEVLEAMGQLRSAGVSILTLGQYLQPTAKHRPVARYVTPEEFDEYKKCGEQMGFDYIASGPLVRSSYKAAEQFIYRKIKGASHD
jgi:lipoic acid synthetase